MQCGWMPGLYNISYTYLERIQSICRVTIKRFKDYSDHQVL